MYIDALLRLTLPCGVNRDQRVAGLDDKKGAVVGFASPSLPQVVGHVPAMLEWSRSLQCTARPCSIVHCGVLAMSASCYVLIDDSGMM